MQRNLSLGLVKVVGVGPWISLYMCISVSLDQTVLMGLSGLLDHTRVIHELLCHPDTDIVAQVRHILALVRHILAHVRHILAQVRDMIAHLGSCEANIS